MAVVIAFSVIKPKIESIRTEQNEVQAYKAAVANIGQYNQRLQALTSDANALSEYDRQMLWRYLPEEVDATRVAADVANMVAQNQMLLLDITASDPEFVSETSADGTVVDPGAMVMDPNTGVVVDPALQMQQGGLMAQQFEVEVVGTYEQMKGLLADIERNNYPLRLVNFSFDLGEEESPLLQYSLVLETYSMSSNPGAI